MATQNYFKAKNGLEAPSQSTIAVTDSNFPTVRPTLNLDFAGSESVDSRITFTRASAATYFGADGKIKYAVQNEPRIDYDPVTGECKGLLIEEQRTNYVPSSTMRSQYWVAHNANMFLQQNAAIAPDGTMTAMLANQTGGSSLFYNSPNSMPTSSVGTTQKACSVYVKAGTTNTVTFNPYYPGDTEVNITFTLSGAGSTDAPASSSITYIGNGWYRIYVNVPSTSVSNTELAFRFWVGTRGTTAAGTMYFWGAQVESAAFPTSYIPSTTTFTSRASSATYFDSTGTLRIAGANQARYGYSYDSTSGKWVSQGLILESAATNLITYSDQINTWINSGAITLTANIVSAPDGTMSADSVYETSTNTTHNVASATFSYTSGTTYTSSVYAKYAGGSRAYFQIAGYNAIAVGTSASANFDLSTGTVTGQSNAIGTIQNVGNGWYRCSMTFTCTNTLTERTNFALINSGTAAPFPQYAGDASVGIYLWGAQTEVGSVATSYIPTLAAAATRAADVSSSAATTRAQDYQYIGGANFTTWFKADEGTIYAESAAAYVAAANRVVSFNNGSTTNHISIINFASSQGLVDVNSVRNTSLVSSNSPVNNAYSKTAFAYQLNNSSLSNNGSAVATAATSALPTNVNTMSIGSQVNGVTPLNGHIKKISYYPKRLSDAQLQALTA